jgi:hypothetical protein
MVLGTMKIHLKSERLECKTGLDGGWMLVGGEGEQRG